MSPITLLIKCVYKFLLYAQVNLIHVYIYRFYVPINLIYIYIFNVNLIKT